MANDKKYLLSTRPLSKAIIEEGAKKDVIIEEASFISTTPIINEELVRRIKELAAGQHTIVFTSMNAVEAVAAQVDAAPHWRIYSIGNTTRHLIEEKWGVESIIATAENAQRLAERLIDDGVRDVVFFCGTIRRPELPNKLRSEGGNVEEVMVYETQSTPSKLQRNYDGILFFSPSAVQAFYSTNKPAKNTVLFAIGKTTEEALRQNKAHKIVVANVTDKSEMTLDAVDYLSGTNQQTK